MKKLLRTFVIETVILYLISLVAKGLVFEEGLKSLVVTGAALTLGTYFIKPVISLLILPLNLITFGLFKWVAHAIMLFLVDLVLTDFTVVYFEFAGFSSNWATLPPLILPHGLLAYAAFSFLISFTTSLIYWLVD